jgi:hypothetical protein
LTTKLRMIGGKLAWYGATPGWVLRLVLGRLVGERLRRVRPETVAAGAIVDWWRIVIAEPDQLVLRSIGWFRGDAWLGYRVDMSSLHQVAAFRPRGVPGFFVLEAAGAGSPCRLRPDGPPPCQAGARRSWAAGVP